MIWPLHTVTRHAMSQDLRDQLQRANVELCDTLPYVQFARLLAGAQFVLADGGSIQEESFFLGKPCLVAAGRDRGETDAAAHPRGAQAVPQALIPTS